MALCVFFFRYFVGGGFNVLLLSMICAEMIHLLFDIVQ